MLQWLRRLNRARVQFLIRVRHQREHPQGLETEPVPCPACGNDSDFSLAYRPYLSSPIRIVECGHCGLRLLRPMPTDAFYRRYYATSYARGWHDSKRNAAADAAFSARNPSFAERAERIYGIVSPRLPADGETSILEVGAAHGMNLEVFKRLQGEVSLYEDELDRRWEDMLVQRGIRNWQQRPDGLQADVLILSHVVEHFRDPVEALRGIMAQMSGQGLIYIEVPNVPEGPQPSLPYKLAHTMYFSPRTLLAVTEAAGLDNLELHQTDVIYGVWKLHASNEVAAAATGG